MQAKSLFAHNLKRCTKKLQALRGLQQQEEVSVGNQGDLTGSRLRESVCVWFGRTKMIGRKAKGKRLWYELPFRWVEMQNHHLYLSGLLAVQSFPLAGTISSPARRIFNGGPTVFIPA